MKITDHEGNVLPKVTIALTPGEAKWVIDNLDNQLDDFPETSDEALNAQLMFVFYSNE